MTAPTPTPGAVLDAESVKLLLPGDVLRVYDPRALLDLGELETFAGQGHPDAFIRLEGRASHFRCTRFTFLGRPDAEGWVSADGVDLSGMQVELRRSDGLWFRLARPTPEGDERLWQKPEIEQDDGEICVRAFTTDNRETVSFSIRKDKVIVCESAIGQPGRVETIRHDQFASPPAQTEPGAGELEVFGQVIERDDIDPVFVKSGTGDFILSASCTVTPVSDHAQAQAKIARLEREVAELTTALSIIEAARVRASTRALSAEADAAKVWEACRAAHDMLIELNPSNYTHDDVCEANAATVEAILTLAVPLDEGHGKPVSWWIERQKALSTQAEGAGT